MSMETQIESDIGEKNDCKAYDDTVSLLSIRKEIFIRNGSESSNGSDSELQSTVTYIFANKPHYLGP